MHSAIKDQRENYKKDEYTSHNLLNELNNIFHNNDNQSKIKTKNIHKNNVKCLFNCTQYKLNLTIKHKNTVVGYQFLNSNNYYYSNISDNQILSLIMQKEETEGININNKFNLENLYEIISDNNIFQKDLTFPIENKNKNEVSFFNNFTSTSTNLGNNSCLLIEFDLDNYKVHNKYFKIINQSFFESEIKCTLNGLVHQKELLKNDIFFKIDPKKLIKSIGNRIENYKNDYLKLDKKNKHLFRYKANFFTPFIQEPNIGILFSTNNKQNLNNIEQLKTNFNSILMKKFILLKLFIAINLPHNHLYSVNVLDKILNENNENDTKSNFDYLNLQLSVDVSHNSFFMNSSNENINNLSNCNNKKIKSNFQIYFKKNNSENITNYPLRNSCFIPKKQNLENIDFKIEKQNTKIKINQILINEKNKFSNEIYKKFKTKSNYLSNFHIFNKILKKLFLTKKDINSISIENFFKIIEKTCSFGLPIPIINESGNYQQLIFSSSLSSMIIFIKNSDFYDSINNKLSNLNNLKDFRLSASTRSNSEDNTNNNFFQVNDFYSENTKTLLYEKYVIIEFNETKPPFLRYSLNEQIKNIFTPFLNSNINIKLSDIDLEKSFFCISWSPINTHQNQTCFLSYYLFNGNLIGILPFKLEVSKWLGMIVYNENEIVYKKVNELKKNITQVENFLFNNNIFNNDLNVINLTSSDYDFFIKNKYIFPK